jgi:CUE domain
MRCQGKAPLLYPNPEAELLASDPRLSVPCRLKRHPKMADKAENSQPELVDLDPTPEERSRAPAPPADAEPPPKPPRALSPREQAKATLKEAFPAIDDNVIEAVLIASGGNIEPAFNALLGTDHMLHFS